MIGYDKRGSVFALVDGAELLLHDGDSEGPLWRKTLDAPIVGVAADGERVVAVTAAGTVTWFAPKTGDVQRTAGLGSKVERAVIAGDRIVAASADKLVTLDGPLADHGAKALAISAEGDVLAVRSDAELVLIKRDGTKTSQRYDGVSPRAVAHHPEGFWVLGLAGKLLKWDGAATPTHITSLPKDSRLDHLACSDKAIAITWDDHMVVAMEWPSKETLGTLQYLERKVTGVAFGPWPWLGVALDLGDGNKFNLTDARLHRSDTHPGRKHNSWMVSVGGSSKAKPAAKPATPDAALPPPPPRGVGLLVGVVVAAAILIYFALVR